MKNVRLTLALTFLAILLGALAVMAQPGCPHGPGVTYISHNPDECATIRFFCAEGQEPFNDECGCGCIETSMIEAAAQKCPDGPEYHYITRNPQLCLVIRFVCEEDQTPFFNECGCGCKDLFVTSATMLRTAGAGQTLSIHGPC